MPLVRFGNITNQSLPREQPNSGRIDNGRTTVNLAGGLKIEFSAAEDNGRLTVEIAENGQTYRGTFLNYDGSVRFIDLTKLVNVAQTTALYSGYELLRVQITERRLLVERGYAPSTTLVRSTQITLKTPSYYGVGVVPVTVFNPDSGLAAGQYIYKNPDSHPAITNVIKDGNAPDTETWQGQQVKIVRLTYKGGNIVSVAGQDFREKAIVQISNLAKVASADITYLLPGRLTFTMPAVNKSEVGKLHRLMVINEDGGSAASDQASPPIYLQFIEGTTGPQIDRLSPAQGPCSGGTQVKIEGKDFRTGLKVYFGENAVTPANTTVVDYKTITVLTPPGLPGQQGVRVENPDGELSAPVDFVYLSCPQVIAVVDPADPTENCRITSISIKGGEELKIKGSGFMDGGRVLFNPVIKRADATTANQNLIYLAGIAYTIESGTEGTGFKYIDSETIMVKTPAGKVGTGGLLVINPDHGASDCYQDITYGLPQLPSPGGVAAELVYDRYIKVHWAAVEGARYYELYLQFNNQLEFLDSVTGTDFVYSDLKPRTSYKFIIKAVGDFGSSPPSASSNTVTTGRVTRPDEDGALEENTTLTRSGGMALVSLGTEDNSSQLVIDLTRGVLAGAKELVVSLPAEVIEQAGPEVIVNGSDYALKFNPGIFNNVIAGSRQIKAQIGVRFKVAPYPGSPNLSGGNTLSPVYALTAELFNGKSSSAVTTLAGNMTLTMDLDMAKSSLRRLSLAALSRYNEYSNSWEPTSPPASCQNAAVTGVINRLGRYTVIGSRR
jgi:hypothetical protein